MAITIVADSLYLSDKPSKIQLYEDRFMTYVEIKKLIYAPNSTLSADGLSFTVEPKGQLGEYDYRVETVDGAEVTISIFFQGDYYKDTRLNSDFEVYFPENLFRWSDQDPETAIMKSTEDLVKETYPLVNKVPLLDKAHRTNSIYCTNQLIGIAMSTAYQFYVDGYDLDWTKVYIRGIKRYIRNIPDFLDICTPLGMPNEKGLYTEIDLRGDNYKLRYGANSNGLFVGRQRAIYISPYKSAGLPEITDWESIQGVPVTSELLLATDNKVIETETLTSLAIPTLHRWQGKEDDYRPDKWLANLSEDYYKGELIIKFDGSDFILVLYDVSRYNNIAIYDSTNSDLWYDTGLYGDIENYFGDYEPYIWYAMYDSSSNKRHSDIGIYKK